MFTRTALSPPIVFRFFAILSAALAALAAAASALAQEVRTAHAVSELVLERAALVPGERGVIALRQRLQPGWHVYWKNFGTTGQPLSLSWSAPEGYAFGDIQFPAPYAKATGPIVDYVIDGAPTFFISVDVPADAPLGGAVEIVADAYWLICDDVCVPEDATLRITAPIAAEAGEVKPWSASARAALPRAMPDANVKYAAEPELLLLEVDEAMVGRAREVMFFAEEQGLVKPAAAQIAARSDGRFALALTPDYDYAPDALDAVAGVLRVGDGENAVSYEISAERGDISMANAAAIAQKLASSTDEANAEGRSAPRVGFIGWLGAIGAALIGGVLLNLMPCVFPVMFVKAAGIAKAASSGDAREVRTHALAYAAGVVASFLALALALYALRAGGAEIGWGFQLQSPFIVGLLTVVMVLVGLNLAGMFETGVGLQRAGGALLGERAGLAGAFLTGVLAVALAAPCIGPFVGGALGLAVAQPGFGGVLVFASLGIGLAAPYLVLAASPASAAKLPKPGPWMARVRQALAFPVFATALWLLWVASVQAGSIAVLYVGGASLAAALAVFLLSLAPAADGLRWAARAGALVSAVLAIGALSLATPAPQTLAGDAPAGGRLRPLAYSAAAVADLRAEGRPVFVEFTAAWCVTCQVNKQTVLKRPAVEEAFRAANAAYVVGDWTHRDGAITEALAAHGRSGVPLYLFYAPGAEEAAVLPQILSVETITRLFADG